MANAAKHNRIVPILTTLSSICLVVGALSFLDGHQLIGLALILAGLILRVERKIEEYRPNISDKVNSSIVSEPNTSEPAEELMYFLNLTTPYLESESGWDRVTVLPESKTFHHEYCFGGPPSYDEVYEYEIKDGKAVYQRLKDCWYDDIYEDHVYEVVNGCVQEALINQKNREHAEWIAASGGQYAYPPPYPDDALNLRQKLIWHELKGALRYFILSKHGYYWRGDVERLRDSFTKLTADAEALGAILNKYGSYELPVDADEESRRMFSELFSETVLRKKYRIPSFRVWVERDQIVALLSPNQNE